MLQRRWCATVAESGGGNPFEGHLHGVWEGDFVTPGACSDEVIYTERLGLHVVRPAEYELLDVNRGDPRLWRDRGFSNPLGHLIADPGPLPHRIPRIRANPDAAAYLMRMAVLRSEGIVIGSAGFHDLPDTNGMIEIGLGVEPAHRGHGLATEMLRGLWGWVIDQPGVRVLRYTVAPDNAPSQAIIARFGFRLVGQQIDDEDGLEDIFEMDADTYRVRWGS